MIDTKVWPFLGLVFFCSSAIAIDSEIFKDVEFSESDSIRVVEEGKGVVYQWRPKEPRIPASLTKLALADLSIKKWGLDKHFVTDFYLVDDVLWIKAYGDPYIVSEEMPLIADGLNKALRKRNATVGAIAVDNSHFARQVAPGRSSVSDPYNAPVSALSVNFNTVFLAKHLGQLATAESQTPLTPLAHSLANTMRDGRERVNLQTATNAQRYFVELLSHHAKFDSLALTLDQRIPADAQLVYQHTNTKNLADALKGTLEFSNNFIANQLFLNLPDGLEPKSFVRSADYTNSTYKAQQNWTDFVVQDGAGLSRSNRLSAKQIDDLLVSLSAHKSLLKEVKTTDSSAVVRAKTGTLDGVRSYAGFIELQNRHFRFVFIFNRQVPFAFRDTLLNQLIADLK